MPSPEIADLIKRYQRYRNALELLQYTKGEFVRRSEEIALTDEVIAWALTVTSENEPGDAVSVAECLRARLATLRKDVPA